MSPSLAVSLISVWEKVARLTDKTGPKINDKENRYPIMSPHVLICEEGVNITLSTFNEKGKKIVFDLNLRYEQPQLATEIAVDETKSEPHSSHSMNQTQGKAAILRIVAATR
ncbi:hypothetical protein GWN42_09940 [candidate division KSB1 bacterium]|nr:hypothetical protein [candidate division KSB1 bacterium]NIS22957.1 hypothetical protein [candidate division KSB1 bacterium]NIU23488.1 hypothetical protein [candidate division KSB1 bacterium]NIU90830.1 hypothetical protein [candidate division KSB1 bacterium]NIV93101.1 hypothetical protein [candidate division KSB1 bacterium]